MDPKDIVRRGYDALSYRYRGDAEEPAPYATWLAQLRERVPAGGAILDLGCGCGVPLARDLAGVGYAVTGVDLSAVQVERARQLVPSASFLHADAAQVGFPPSSFDAVLGLYALIHLPLDEQPSLLGRIGRWLRPGGWFLATTGHRAWTGTEDGWLGGEAPMWWSHADAATYRAWIEQAGLAVVAQGSFPRVTVCTLCSGLVARSIGPNERTARAHGRLPVGGVPTRLVSTWTGLTLRRAGATAVRCEHRRPRRPCHSPAISSGHQRIQRTLTVTPRRPVAGRAPLTWGGGGSRNCMACKGSNRVGE
jgi:SAM-dependent methyltransferase